MSLCCVLFWLISWAPNFLFPFLPILRRIKMLFFSLSMFFHFSKLLLWLLFIYFKSLFVIFHVFFFNVFKFSILKENFRVFSLIWMAFQAPLLHFDFHFKKTSVSLFRFCPFPFLQSVHVFSTSIWRRLLSEVFLVSSFDSDFSLSLYLNAFVLFSSSTSFIFPLSRVSCSSLSSCF